MTGSGNALEVNLRGGVLDGATLQIRIYESTPEQRAAFVVGNRYEIDVPDMPPLHALCLTGEALT